MNTKAKLSLGISFLFVLLAFLFLLLIARGRWTITIVSSPDPHPPAQPGIILSRALTLTAAVPELGTAEAGRQDISLGRIEEPGRYVLQLANDNPPFSGYWLEWDYLALKARDSFVWQIGQSETPPDYNFTGQAADEYCSTAAQTDCRTGFEVIAGTIDEGSFPKTLNDGAFPVIRIVFTVTQEQTDVDLVLTLSTLYSSHLPDTKGFRMQVTLQGPY
jgi:hypothetical protein